MKNYKYRSGMQIQVVRQRLNMRRCLYNYLLICYLSPTCYLNYHPFAISIIAYLCAYKLAGGLVSGLAGIIYNLSGLEETNC